MKRIQIALTTLLASLAAGASVAQDACRLQRLDVTLPGAGRFGDDLAQDGGHLLITSVDSLLSSPRWSTFLYLRETGGWVPSLPLMPLDPVLDRFEGGAVEADVGQAFVRGFGSSSTGTPQGFVFVFDLDGPNTTEVAQLVRPDGVASATFGGAIACDGTRLAISDTGYIGPAAESGAVFLYEKIGRTWTYQTRLAVPATDATNLGSSLDLKDSLLIAGAPNTTVGGQLLAGRAVVFREGAFGFAQEQTLTANDNGMFAQFGASVAVHGERVAVGAISNFNSGPYSGSVYVYDRVGTNWTLDEELVCPPHGGASGGEFGSALALDAQHLVVGAPNRLQSGTLGSIHVYERLATSWVQTDELLPDAAASPSQRRFGSHLALKDGLVLASSSVTVGTLISSSGSAYVFGLGDDFTAFGTPLPGTTGEPRLDGVGCVVAGLSLELQLTNARPNALALLAGSKSLTNIALFGGVLYIGPNLPVLLPFVTDPQGDASFVSSLVPSTQGETFFLQAGILDPVAQAGVALTNALIVQVR